MKTVVISSFHPLISRNILETSVLSRIAERGIRIVLLVPEAKKEYFVREFGTVAIVEGINVQKKRFENLLYSLSLSLVDVHNHVVDDWKVQGRYAKYYTAHLLHALFSRFFVLHLCMRCIAHFYMRKVVFDRVFSKYKPDLVFATDVFDLSDGSLVVAASQHGTPTVGMVRSWDNPTTKGVLLAVPGRLVVHSEVLRDELVSIHHIRADHITVTGIPHQDAVVTWSPASRDMFFSELGLDSKKKTILFAPGGRG